MRTKRLFADDFKAPVAIESINGEKTTSELSGIYEVHSNQSRLREKHLLENVDSVFPRKKKNLQIAGQEKPTPERYKKSGKQNIELEFLKIVQTKAEPIRKEIIEKGHIRKQREILGIIRANYHYTVESITRLQLGKHFGRNIAPSNSPFRVSSKSFTIIDIESPGLVWIEVTFHQ